MKQSIAQKSFLENIWPFGEKRLPLHRLKGNNREDMIP